MARLAPTEKVVKQLFALSGNRCAFDGCTVPMVENGKIIGQICHIEAANETGSRFNKERTDEQLRGFENLILLCPTHHTLTHDEKLYPVDRMKLIKAEHETRCVGRVPEFSEELIAQTMRGMLSAFFNEENPPHNPNNAPQGTAWYKPLDVKFWDTACRQAIQKENYLLGLYAQEAMICSAIIHGLASPADYSFDNEFFAAEDKINNLGLAIEQALANCSAGLVVVTAPPGAGKTTLLYQLAFDLYSKYQVIRITGQIPPSPAYISDQGIVLLDEIKGHEDDLTRFRTFFENAFPKGFVLVIADQALNWNLFNERTKMLRDYDPVLKLGIKPRQSTLENIYQKLEHLLADSENPITIPTALKRKMLRISEQDTRTIADRIIELYYALGITKSQSGFIKPDWISIDALNKPELSELYRLTAYAHTCGEDFDLKILGEEENTYLPALGLIRANSDDYPLKFAEATTSLRLRHQTIAKWYFNENPEQRPIAALQFRAIFKRGPLSPERIRLMRKFYQHGPAEFLAMMSWTLSNYYEALSAYHREHQYSDLNLQARKSFHESLKILYKINLPEYEHIIDVALLTGNDEEKRWLSITIVKNLLRSEDFKAAKAKIIEFSAYPWAPPDLELIFGDVYLKEALASISQGNVLDDHYIRSLPANAVYKIARELSKSVNRHARYALFGLLDLYFRNPVPPGTLTEAENETLLLTYCRILTDREDFTSIIEALDYRPYTQNSLLLTFMGYALLHRSEEKMISRHGTPKALLYKAFCQAPGNLSTIVYLDQLLTKSRIDFNNEELETIREKLAHLQTISPHPAVYKCLSDAARRQSGYEASVVVLRNAISEYPSNDHIRNELTGQLLYIYETKPTDSIRGEIDRLIVDFGNKDNNYYKLLLIRYHQTFYKEAPAFHINAAWTLIDEVRSDPDFKSTADFQAVRTSFLEGAYKDCIQLIIELYYSIGDYHSYDIGNFFYKSLLLVSKPSDEAFLANCEKYGKFINRLLRDTSFETNEYFRYVRYIVNRDFDDPQYSDEIKTIERSLQDDSVRAFNPHILETVIDFLFHTNHFNSIRKLIQFIRTSGKKQYLTPGLLFNFKVCSILTNNRIFIEGPTRESKNLATSRKV